MSFSEMREREAAFDLESSPWCRKRIETENEQSGGCSSKTKAWLGAVVITEHDGSITAVIRHQTKGRTERKRQRAEDGPRRSCSVTRPLDEVSASEQEEGGQSKCSSGGRRQAAGSHSGPFTPKTFSTEVTTACYWFYHQPRPPHIYIVRQITYSIYKMLNKYLLKILLSSVKVTFQTPTRGFTVCIIIKYLCVNI